MSKLNCSASQISQYLYVDLPPLSEADREYLNGPLQLEELQEAIASMANNKSPGSDGLSVELYKRYRDILLPQLLQVFQDAMNKPSLPRSM